MVFFTLAKEQEALIIKTTQQITLTIYPQVELEMPMVLFILAQEQEAHTTIILQQTQ